MSLRVWTLRGRQACVGNVRRLALLQLAAARDPFRIMVGLRLGSIVCGPGCGSVVGGWPGKGGDHVRIAGAGFLMCYVLCE